MELEKATFGAGCFWHVQYAFDRINGVARTYAGYLGGSTKNPSYKEVCSDKTGHAEVVCIEFDPKITSYDKLLAVFWQIHNPTQLNRQGPDVGTQYRSVIFYHTLTQKKKAIASRDILQKLFKDKKVVTEIVKAGKFYLAEDYHQHYLERKGLNMCG